MEIQIASTQKIAAQLQSWSAAINLLKARAEVAAVDRQAKRAQALYALRLQQRAAFGKMQELKKASGEVLSRFRKRPATVADAHSSLK